MRPSTVRVSLPAVAPMDHFGEVSNPIRAYCLGSAALLSPGDLQREHRLTYNDACRALEELEALRLLGSMQVGGARRWGVFLPVDEARVRMLRRVLGCRSEK